MSDESVRVYSDDEVIDRGFVHIRFKSGFELLGNMLLLEKNEDGMRPPCIYKPVRASISGTGCGVEVKLMPYSFFSNDDIFTFEWEDVEFIVELNDTGLDNYFKFINSYEDSTKPTLELSGEASVESKRTLH